MALFYSKSTSGFYDDSIHTSTQIPSDAVSITQAQYNALILGQSSGQLIQADPTTGIPVLVSPAAPSLDAVKAAALVSIDAAAEVVRGLFITANSGQVATYILKYNESTAFAAANYTGTVPGLVQSEATVTNTTPQAAADSIIAQYTTWSQLAAAIETVRRAAKIAVGVAVDAAGVAAAIASSTTGFAQIEASASATS